MGSEVFFAWGGGGGEGSGQLVDALMVMILTEDGVVELRKPRY